MSTLTFVRVKTFKKNPEIHSNFFKNLLHILLKTFQKMKKRKTDRYPLNPEAGEKDKK